MTMASSDGGYLGDLPGALVVKAQQDLDFALRLLNSETREAAFDELGLELSEDERGDLHDRLDAIARMSFQEAMQMLRSSGVGILM
jgi:hypothetical protein